MNNNIHCIFGDVITHPCPNFNVEVRARMSRYISHFSKDEITYLRPKTDGGLSNNCK